MKQIPSFTEVHDKPTVASVKAIPDEIFNQDLPIIPGLQYHRISYDDIRIKLFRLGVSHANTESIIAALRQCNQLADWYNLDGKANGRPTENEVVSHMVLPLLLALGWSHQQIAVEWKNVDVALFLKTPTDIDNCVGIIEAKGIGHSLGERFWQPQNYINKLKLKNVRKVIITDGPNIFIYNRKGGSEFDNQPDGYLNVNFLAERYLLPEDTSAVKTLVQLLPSQF